MTSDDEIDAVTLKDGLVQRRQKMLGCQRPTIMAGRNRKTEEHRRQGSGSLGRWVFGSAVAYDAMAS